MRDWYDENVTPPPKPVRLPRDKGNRDIPKVRTPATPEDRMAMAAVAPHRVTYPVASFHKRFARDIQGAAELTDGQRRVLWGMVLRYRRQIPSVELVNAAIRKCEAFAATRTDERTQPNG